MIEASGSSASNTFLVLAAARGYGLAVATDYGMQTGYLVGIDETHVVLFGPYRKGDESTWTIILVPRNLMTFIEAETTVEDESEEVQRSYSNAAGQFVKQCKEHIRQMQSVHPEEGSS